MQAILITAYKDYGHLEKIIKFFDHELFEIFIHVDKKSVVSREELSRLKRYKAVKLVARRYRVNWGGVNHLRSILYLLQKAFKNRKINYFHLISGNDYPVKSKSEFIKFFQNSNKDYIECFEVPNPKWKGNGGLDRLMYFNFYDFLNAKNKTELSMILNVVKWQKKIGLQRSISEKIPRFFGGSTWWSLSRTTIEYVLHYNKQNNYFFNRLKFTFCSEEFFFQTIIMNSKYAQNVQNNNLRYIDWNKNTGSGPATLNIEDLKKIANSDAFFARKFDPQTSQDLLTDIVKLISLK
jgi:hypothetical protein